MPIDINLYNWHKVRLIHFYVKGRFSTKNLQRCTKVKTYFLPLEIDYLIMFKPFSKCMSHTDESKYKNTKCTVIIKIE